MKNFHIKSILLGLGIGIILTSIISMIYMAGVNSNKPQMSDAEILSKAKQLGLVEPDSILDDKKNDTVKEEKRTDIPTQKDNETRQPTVQKPQTPSAEEVQLNIVGGDTSETVAKKLLALGLVKDTKTFVDKLTEMKLTSEINIGHFKIKKDTSVEQIVKIITTVPK